jgi:type III secretion system FlhB-like substrate exporter
VIASDAGALAEPILDTQEKNGTVIQPNNLKELVKALEDLPIALDATKKDDGN